MFPNPQDALPLPLRPNLEQYRKLAKELVKVCKSGNAASLYEWVSEWIGNLVRLSGLAIIPHLPVENRRWINEVNEFATRKLFSEEGECTLANAQFVIARSHGFISWPGLAKHIEQLSRNSSAVAQFEQAADAIVSGDLRTLKRLLRENHRSGMPAPVVLSANKSRVSLKERSRDASAEPSQPQRSQADVVRLACASVPCRLGRAGTLPVLQPRDRPLPSLRSSNRTGGLPPIWRRRELER